ncbi:MAG: hypothetical protein ACLR2G_08830 [Phascolarctobacterium faecium]
MEPIKRQRKESDSVYTIMLIPHKGHEPRSIHFRLSLLKKVGIVCGLLCLLGAGVLFQSSHILYKAHQDQQELLTYRSEKAVQEQKIGQLLQENEAIEKEMAELSKLEEAVRRELGEGAVQPSRSGIDRSQYLGQGGPQAAKVEAVDIYAAQNKVLQEKVKDRKATLNDLLGRLRGLNQRKAALPTLGQLMEVLLLHILAVAAILSVIVLMTGIRELILPMTLELRFMPARLALLKRLAGCPVMAVM